MWMLLAASALAGTIQDLDKVPGWKDLPWGSPPQAGMVVVQQVEATTLRQRPDTMKLGSATGTLTFAVYSNNELTTVIVEFHDAQACHDVLATLTSAYGPATYRSATATTYWDGARVRAIHGMNVEAGGCLVSWSDAARLDQQIEWERTRHGGWWWWNSGASVKLREEAAAQEEAARLARLSVIGFARKMDVYAELDGLCLERRLPHADCLLLAQEKLLAGGEETPEQIAAREERAHKMLACAKEKKPLDCWR